MVLVAFALIPALMMRLLGMISIGSPKRLELLVGVCLIWGLAGSAIVILGNRWDRLVATLCFAQMGAGILGWSVALIRRFATPSTNNPQ